jgi:predicted dehydrogenase
MPDTPIPVGVDYNKWLGPAKNRPFNVNRFHYEFRWFWNYAGGLMTDWGVHLIDIVLWAMNVTEPKSVSAVGGKRLFPNDARETPDYQSVVYDFGHFTNSWEHYIGISNGQYGRSHGIAFIGTNETLVVNRSGWEVIPEKDKDKLRIETVPLIRRSDIGMDLHAQNFVEVMKNGKLDQLACPIQAAANVAINAHMGNLAYRSGEKIYWDATKNKFNNEKANALIKPTYHNGFVFPKYN